ncbi:OLC1v1009842C1 [Oldenlandia corymbosa var. corymbosa]|uniref:OLC1v1009842C1 n=1 Tax=Oldenlandia corymbosa var. corymbosa TaxID=529605 RepID=A0AAV1DQ37_OLDCO|nr:OLC1v1009842C1 [Oldenlandia corymbosa var. corymbosa]
MVGKYRELTELLLNQEKESSCPSSSSCSFITQTSNNPRISWVFNARESPETDRVEFGLTDPILEFGHLIRPKDSVQNSNEAKLIPTVGPEFIKFRRAFVFVGEVPEPDDLAIPPFKFQFQWGSCRRS